MNALNHNYCIIMNCRGINDNSKAFCHCKVISITDENSGMVNGTMILRKVKWGDGGSFTIAPSKAQTPSPHNFREISIKGDCSSRSCGYLCSDTSNFGIAAVLAFVRILDIYVEPCDRIKVL